MVVSSPDALIGRVIAAKYVIESYLGGGAMGTVYKARQVALEKVVALKVMRPELASDASFVGRFRREARAASKLSHANSISVSDFGQEPDGLLYIVMEFVAGRDLERIMIDDGVPLHDRRIIDILSQVLSAVAVAHDHGIVHRDLKPANFLIVKGVDDEGKALEHVKVCDFGIASMHGSPLDADAGVTTGGIALSRRDAGKKLTATGTLLGTPEYMSPEQASGHTLDAASDVYSVGAILYELMTGRTVFLADTPHQMVFLQMTGVPAHPRTIRPCNEHLAAVCMRALSRKPEDRYPSARAMRAEMRAVAANIESGVRQGPTTVALAPPVRTSVPASSLAGTDASPTTLVGPPTAPPRSLTGTLSSEPSLPDFAATPSSAPRTELASSPLESKKPSRRVVFVALGVFFLASGVYASMRGRNGNAPPPVVTVATGEARRPFANAVPAAGPSATVETSFERAADPALPLPGAGVKASAVSVSVPRHGDAPLRVGAAEPVKPAPAHVEAPPGVESPPAVVAPPLLVSASSVAPPPVAPPAPSPAADVKPFTPDAARVSASVVAAARTSRGSVASIVSHVSFDGCYRDALRTLGRPEGGAGTAHLEIDEDGVVRAAEVRLPGPLSGAVSCFASKLRGQRVSVPDTGAATADIAFTLVPN